MDHETTTRSLGSRPRRPVHVVALGLELQQHVGLFGEKRHGCLGKADERIQRQAVGDLAGADAEEDSPGGFASISRVSAMRSSTLLNTLRAGFSAR